MEHPVVCEVVAGEVKSAVERLEAGDLRVVVGQSHGLVAVELVDGDPLQSVSQWVQPANPSPV